MSVTIQEIRYKAAGETITSAFDLTDMLQSGETLSGPSLAEVGTADLTIASVAVSVATLTIKGRSVTTGQAVTCTIAGGKAGERYRLKLTTNTTGGTHTQTLIIKAFLGVVADD